MQNCVTVIYMSLTPIGDAISGKFKSQDPLKKQIEAVEITDAATSVFDELFPPDLARHAKPQYLKNRTLTVSCTSSALAQEIRLNQAKIVDSINSKLGDNLVDRIRYLA